MEPFKSYHKLNGIIPLKTTMNQIDCLTYYDTIYDTEKRTFCASDDNVLTNTSDEHKIKFNNTISILLILLIVGG